MAIDNWIGKCRETIWDALHAEAEWRRLARGATEHRFTGEGLLARVITKPAECPVVAIGPSAATLPAVEEMLKDDEDCRTACQLVTKGADATRCERLLLAFRLAITNHWGTFKTLRTSRLVRIRFENVEFSMIPDDTAMPQMWSCEFDLVFLFEPATT